MTFLFEGRAPPPRKRGRNFLPKQGGSIWVLGTYNTYVMLVPSHIGYLRGGSSRKVAEVGSKFLPPKKGYLVIVARKKKRFTNLLHKHMLFDSLLPNTESHSEMRNLPTPSDICWKGRFTCKLSLGKIPTYPPWNKQFDSSPNKRSMVWKMGARATFLVQDGPTRWAPYQI